MATLAAVVLPDRVAAWSPKLVPFVLKAAKTSVYDPVIVVILSKLRADTFVCAPVISVAIAVVSVVAPEYTLLLFASVKLSVIFSAVSLRVTVITPVVFPSRVATLAAVVLPDTEIAGLFV